MSGPHAIERRPYYGFACAVVGSVLVSTNFVTAKCGTGGDGNPGFNYAAFSLVWTGAAGVFSLALCLAGGHARDLAVPRRSLPGLIVLGLLTAAGMLLAWGGLTKLDASFTAFVWRFTPVMGILLGVGWFGERFSWHEWVAVGVMVAGGCLSCMGRWDVVGFGVVLSLLACLLAALQRFVAKLHSTSVHPSVLMFYRTGLGTAFLVVYILVADGLFAADLGHFDVPRLAWAWTLTGAFFGPCLSFYFRFRAYRHWDLARVSIVETAEPLFVLPQAMLVLGRLPVARELLGGAVIMAGAFGLAAGRLTRRRRPQDTVPYEGSDK